MVYTILFCFLWSCNSVLYPQKSKLKDLDFFLLAHPAGISQRLVCYANCRRFSPVTVVCRVRSPAPARLCALALWVTPFEKTIIDCFLCTNPAGGSQEKRPFSNGLFSIQSEGLACNLTAGEYVIAEGVWHHASACISPSD